MGNSEQILELAVAAGRLEEIDRRLEQATAIRSTFQSQQQLDALHVAAQQLICWDAIVEELSASISSMEKVCDDVEKKLPQIRHRLAQNRADVPYLNDYSTAGEDEAVLKLWKERKMDFATMFERHVVRFEGVHPLVKSGGM